MACAWPETVSRLELRGLRALGVGRPAELQAQVHLGPLSAWGCVAGAKSILTLRDGGGGVTGRSLQVDVLPLKTGKMVGEGRLNFGGGFPLDRVKSQSD